MTEKIKVSLFIALFVGILYLMWMIGSALIEVDSCLKSERFNKEYGFGYHSYENKNLQN